MGAINSEEKEQNNIQDQNEVLEDNSQVCSDAAKEYYGSNAY